MYKVEVASEKASDYMSREAFKTIRTNLEFCGDDVRVIAITSCVAHEGKSDVSMNLAIAFAEMGNKVLFVDTDLRKSTIGAAYKISSEQKGLTNLLSGRCEARDAILDTDVHNLHMIYAGPIPPNPTELLGNKRFKEFIADARENYDYVIVDTPPLGTVIDFAVISPAVDGAVFLIAASEISRKFAMEVKTRLIRANCRILGVILNKVDVSKNGYYSKYYGKKYGGKYYGGYGYARKEETENKK